MINGSASDRIDVADRGLNYGDGLFETIAVRGGAPRFWQRHLQRLAHGCERLGLPAPESQCLASEAAELCVGVERAVLKIIITRGVGGRGYRPPTAAQATRIVALHPWPDHPSSYVDNGITARICETRLGHQPLLGGIKHLNRLEQVMARAEWDDVDVIEGVMLNNAGEPVCGTMSNLFVVHGGVLMTPDVSDCGIAGITRQRIIEIAREWGLSCDPARLTLDQLHQADESFVCNSIIGIWPLRRIGAWTFPVGPITRRFVSAVAEQAG